MKKEKVEYKLSPQQYRDALKHFELESITLESIKADLNRERLTGGMKTFIKDKVSHEILSENKVNFSHNFVLVITKKNKRDYAVKIDCTYNALFSYGSEDIGEAFLEIFSNSNIYLNTWPFSREFIQNTLVRMGLPPLTLPLLKK